MAEQAPKQPDATNAAPAEMPGRQGEAAAATAQAVEALQSASRAVGAIAAEALAGDQPQALNLPDFGGGKGRASATPSDLDLLSEVNLHVKVELGRTRMYVEDVLRLSADSVIELDKLAGDPVDIYVNDHHVARGEVLVVNDNFCVRVSEIIQKVGR